MEADTLGPNEKLVFSQAKGKFLGAAGRTGGTEGNYQAPLKRNEAFLPHRLQARRRPTTARRHQPRLQPPSALSRVRPRF